MRDRRIIDDIDLQILHIIQEKARIPNAEVARQVGMTPSAVLERIRKLETQGVIQGYEVRLNPEVVDRQLVAFVEVGFEAGMREAVQAALGAMEDVQEIHLVSGGDSFFLKVRAAELSSLAELMHGAIASLAGVTGVSSRVVLHTAKETANLALPPVSAV